MSDRSERLFSTLSQLSSDHIDEAAESEKRRHKPIRWKRWGTAAACITLAVVTGSVFPHLGGCGAGSNGESTPSAGEGASEFMSYAGPVLPMTLSRENPAIKAERDITLDFAPWAEQYGDKLLVSDQYVLTNSSAETQTVTVQLPFQSSLSQLSGCKPELTLDGKPLETDLLAGVNSQEMSFSTWEDYDSLLADGSYRTEAVTPQPVSAPQPVIVYSFTDAWGPEKATEEVPNPSIQAAFDLDYDATQVMTYGFNGGRNDREHGHMIREFSIPRAEKRQKEIPLLILLGDDLENLTAGAYITGGSDPSTPQLENAGVTVNRHETNLEEVLRWILHRMEDEAGDWSNNEVWMAGIELLDFETRYRILQKELEEIFGDDLMEINDQGGRLEDPLDLMVHCQRIFWVTAEVTIPAEERCTLIAVSQKEPSYDYACSGSPNAEVGLRGYDMMPWLDSNLTFASQTAILVDRGLVEIVRQNFGFDVENGVKQVQLFSNTPHYYLEVRRAESPES